MSDFAASDDLPPPPRMRSFLARYPRNVKLAATVFLFAALVLPPAWIHGRLAPKDAVVAAPAAVGAQGAPDTANPNVPAVAARRQTPAADASTPDSAADAGLSSTLNDPNDRSVKLMPAPDPRVTEDTSQGSLPRVGEDGSSPWRLYARPFDTSDPRPRIALLVDGLGLDRLTTDQAIARLPPAVTLAFDARGPVTGAWIARARQEGHEALLDLPAEPYDFPRSDPGPLTLLTNLPNSDNLMRLQTALRSGSGYVGVLMPNGSRFVTDAGKLSPLLLELRTRGLMLVDAHASPHSALVNVAKTQNMPAVEITQKLDRDLSPAAIANALSDLEKTAQLTGSAIGFANLTPLMVQQIQLWAQDLPKRGFALAPVSVMVK